MIRLNLKIINLTKAGTILYSSTGKPLINIMLLLCKSSLKRIFVVEKVSNTFFIKTHARLYFS